MNGTRMATVFMKGDRAAILSGVLNKNGAAMGKFRLGLNKTGWDVLDIKAGYATGAASVSDKNLLYASGYLEGYLTADRITLNYKNLFDVTFKGLSKVQIQQVKNWFHNNDVWVRKLISNPTSQQDPFVRHLSYVIAQMDGLYDGFVANNGYPKDKFVVFFLNGIGDIIDLMNVLHKKFTGVEELSKLSRMEAKLKLLLSGHCSALVKILPGYENIFMAHSSWFDYTNTMRIYKHYNFNLRDPDTAAKKTSFSSYPGFLESLDDFYLLSSGMVMLQTTNQILNTSLYKFVTPNSLLAWQRVRVANWIARSGVEWAQSVARHNSGTYNNQYMIIDLKRIRLKQTVEDGTLTIVEQIPSLVEYSDQTNVLRAGYWPSYNVPFHEKIYNLSGYPELVKQQGPDFSYQQAPRAKIFRRDANKVSNMEDFKTIMRYNNYTRDPYSEGNACDTICCRGDLLGSHASADGCYDSKTTDYHSALQLSSLAISGPTRASGVLKPFAWTGKFNAVPHLGLPSVYNFTWQNMKPDL